MKVKDYIERWCERNNYIIVDVSNKEIPTDTVFKIASKATKINGTIEKTDQRPEYSFARYLAIAYLDSKMATGILAKALNLDHSMISYARKQNLFNEDLRYFKGRQKSAIEYFKKMTEGIEKRIKLYHDETEG